MKLIAAPVIEVRRRLKRLEALPWWWWCAFALVVLLCVAAILNLPNVQAWATIALLIVTMRYVMLIHKSILNTIILRREDRELDFKLRKLDWIVNTAREIKKGLLMPVPLFQVDSTVKSTLIKEVQNYLAEWSITIDTAKIFGAEFERIVEKAAKDLFDYMEELKKPASDITDMLMGLNKSFRNVLKSALKVESDLVKI